MVINIQGTGLKLTAALKEHAWEKMASMQKYFENIQQIDIDLGVRNRHHQKGNIFYAEANVHVPGKILRVVKDTEDIYKAIDKVKDHLKVEFEKLKGKMRQKNKHQLREQKSYQI